jgi:antitoxin YefM
VSRSGAGGHHAQVFTAMQAVDDQRDQVQVVQRGRAASGRRGAGRLGPDGAATGVTGAVRRVASPSSVRGYRLSKVVRGRLVTEEGVRRPDSSCRAGRVTPCLAVYGLLSWSMTTLPLSEVKARLSEIADDVDRTHERVHVTRNGREYVVLLSAQDFASLEATIELLADQAAMRRVRRADADVAAGKVTGGDEMAELMAKRRQRERRDA